MGSSQIILLLLCLIMAHGVFVGLAMATERAQSPANGGGERRQNDAVNRKIGSGLGGASPSGAPAPGLRAVEEPDHDEEGGRLLTVHVFLPRKHHFHDKSVAGGGVILVGLAATFLGAIVCYIRATRRKSAEMISV